MNWTDDRVELLKKLWADGLSASHIAIELGGISRNSVIGKVHRLGLAARAKSPAAATQRQRKPRSQSTVVSVAHPVINGNTALVAVDVFEAEIEIEAEAKPQVPPPVVENVVAMGQQRCTILDLGTGKCRWPVGDPSSADFFFCGAKTAEGLPYCGHHSRMAYQPTDRRRDRPAPAARL